MERAAHPSWEEASVEATIDVAVKSGPPTNTTGGPGSQVSVVIPALNEADNLPHVLPLIPDWVHEILVVDGASTDGTPEVARQLRPEVRIVQQAGRGKGAALRS